MTIKELYEWAVSHDAIDYTLMIQYRDDGGYYYGYEEADYPEVDHNKREITI